MVPKKDLDLFNWTRNFTQRILADAGHFGLSQPQVDELEAKWLAFEQAYSTQRRELAAGVRSMSLTTEKDRTKSELQAVAREIYAILSASRAIESGQKIELGIHVRLSNPSPIARPDAAPWISIKSVVGRRITVRIAEAKTTRKGKPRGCAGAVLFSAVADEAPVERRQWRCEGLMTRSTKTILFNDVEPGQQVWLCAAWYSPRGETGAASTPISTYTVAGAAEPVALLRAA